MGINDNPKIRRDYQRLWMASKRGNREATKELRTKYPPRRIGIDFHRKNVWTVKFTQKKKLIYKKLQQKAGGCCCLCKTKERILFFHRKDFKHHDKLYDTLHALEGLEKDLDNYLLVCKPCHNGIHWLNRVFPDILKQIIY